jgi:hypothetical protein
MVFTTGLGWSGGFDGAQEQSFMASVAGAEVAAAP